jgi:D-alanine-D-alanine ligase-like ATP-grasp enzyme
MKLSNLLFIGADFKIDLNDGHWVILEVNTMPGYAGYDERAKRGISATLLNTGRDSG